MQHSKSHLFFIEYYILFSISIIPKLSVVKADFVSYLEALGEVDISDDYKVEFSTETLEDSFKKAIITVRYDVNGEEKSITINTCESKR